MIASCVSFPVKETVSKENFQRTGEYFRRMACIEEIAHKLNALAILDRGDRLSRFEQPSEVPISRQAYHRPIISTRNFS
jgi:hypothetical protein